VSAAADRSLGALVDATAESLEAIDRTPAGDAVEYRRGGRLFAVVVAETLDVSLAPAVAAAARRTPDVTPAARGAGWVSFRPATLDRYAIDRATAWFEAAWRAAAGPRPN